MHRHEWEPRVPGLVVDLPHPVWRRYVGFGVSVIVGGILFASIQLLLQVLGKRNKNFMLSNC